MRESDDSYCNGQLGCHNISESIASKSVITYSVLAIIFVDDKAALVPSREQLCKGILLIQDLFAKLGMGIHIGTKKLNTDTKEIEWKVAKTKCVFFPPPGFFNPRIDQEEKREESIVLEERLYFNSPETDDVKVPRGRVTYCLHFKYPAHSCSTTCEMTTIYPTESCKQINRVEP